MTSEEIKAAFLQGVPVQTGGIEYARVSALIWRHHAGKIIIQAELQDKRANSVTIAPVERVKLIGKEETA